jgi:serine/threonine-protein kinase RsbW
MSKQDLVELTIPAKAEFVGVARLLVSGVANRLQFTYNEIEDMKVAVAEACTNAVNHAYEDNNGTISLTCKTYGDKIEICVRDSGQSFDVDCITSKMGPIEQGESVEELAEGGLGLFLIETLMDEVQIKCNNGISITMTKYKNKDGVDYYDRPIKASNPR